MSSVPRGMALGRALVRQGQAAAVIGRDASGARAAALSSSALRLHGVPAVAPLATPRICRCLGASGSHGASTFRPVRMFSDAGKEASQEEDVPKDEESASTVAEDVGEDTAEGKSADKSREEDLEAQVKDLKDQLLRSLAEQENTRRIAKRDVDAAKSYAVTSFAKSLLDTSDNLSRALEAVPPEYRSDIENHPVLATLYEGIKMTDDGLTKAFAKNGLAKFGEVGEKFDPHLHEALFEYPDPEKEDGTVGQVMKVGFMLKERVLRPAEVGVVKKA